MLDIFMPLLLICAFFLLVVGIGAAFIRARRRQRSWNYDEQATAVKAVVVDKYTIPVGKNIYGSFTPVRHMVVFLVGSEKLEFEVSEYSFENYNIKESGTLKYCGNELIDFG